MARLAGLDSFELVAVEAPEDDPDSFSMLVETAEHTWTLALERRSVWSPDAQLIVMGGHGERNASVLAPSRTYRGRILEIPGSRVSVGFTDAGFRAVLHRPGEPAAAIEPSGFDDGLSVYYEVSDVRHPSTSCQQPTLADLRQDPREAQRGIAPRTGRPGVVPPGSGNTLGATSSAMYVAELGVDSDFEYFQFNMNSVSRTRDEIAIIVNNINLAYEQDVSIAHVVTRLIVRTDASTDPYTSAEGSAINNEQRAEWTNNQSDALYDLVLHMTGLNTWRPGSTGAMDFSLIGRAYAIGVVCNRSAAFCFSEGTSNDLSQAQFVGHELGHLWNGRHCDNDSSTSNTCINAMPCLLMCSTINGCQNMSLVEFGPCNAGRVIDHRNARQACLDVSDSGFLWVQFRDCGMTCGENGTSDFPFSSLTQTLNATGSPLRVKIFSGTTASAPDDVFPMIISHFVVLEAFNPQAGVVRIGD
ncbi:hypothetical protein Poly30_03960 [Planctomycetes bacterium Poly30]|uniref:Peptidase M12B domain-containing protein n=2 Tax=Saltatorellus ferox TaxID=2528018 RepID=A0A518ELF6_9BACT|nr:hypothetical protein Poly30_03960 [Planctomycetes bacterium Poly30]